MTIVSGPRVVNKNISVLLDANNPRSYTTGGTKWNDLSSNNANVNFNGSPNFINDSIKSFEIRTANNTIQTNSSSFNTFSLNPFTIECWFYCDKNDSCLISKGESAATGTFSLHINAQGFIVFTTDASTVVFTYPVDLNKWTQLSLVREGTGTNQCKLYINSTLVESGTCSSNLNSTGTVRIGADRGGSTKIWGGYISLLTIYQVALTAANVLQNFETKKSKFSLNYGALPVRQSLIYKNNGIAYQIKMLNGIFLNTYASPNSTGPSGSLSNGGEARINPATQAHYVSAYYGTSGSANFPFYYGTFSYNTGFGSGTLYSAATSRTSYGLTWSKDGRGLISSSDIFSYSHRFNTTTGVPFSSSFLTGNGIGDLGSFSPNSNYLVLHADQFATPTVYAWNWNSDSGLGSALTGPAVSPNSSYFSRPLWTSNGSFVFIGNIAYTFNAGFTTPRYDTFTNLGYYVYLIAMISDTMLLVKKADGSAYCTLSFNPLSGFSQLATTTPVGVGDAVYDPVYSRFYYVSGGILYYKTISSSGQFSSAVTALTSAVGEIVDVFTHTI